jgi:hypothetical protein
MTVHPLKGGNSGSFEDLDIPPSLQRAKSSASPKLPETPAQEEAGGGGGDRSPPSPPAPPASPAAAPDPFDVNALRFDQSFVEAAGVKKLLTTVPVKKPNGQDFIRVNPDPAYRAQLATIEIKDDREVYLLTPRVAVEVPNEISMVMLYTTINRQGVVSLWPVKLPTPDGRVNDWHNSAAQAAVLAMDKWVRVKANMSLGAYEVFQSEGLIPDPEWPAHTFNELLKIGFRDKLVDNFEHPLIKRLRGYA